MALTQKKLQYNDSYVQYDFTVVKSGEEKSQCAQGFSKFCSKT